jgi:uncharacterized SAM-binding protein YcdF (DUF218 family)
MRIFNQLTEQQLADIRDYIMPETPMKAADIALFFGTRHGLDEFYKETMALYHSGLYKNLVISGGPTGGLTESEASLIRQALVTRGHSEEKIIIEDQATNTGENVHLSMKAIDRILGLRNVQSIIAIGKISSARRYLMTLEKWWPAPQKIMAPVNYFETPREHWFKNENFRTRVLTEFQKIPQYIESGFITELDTKFFGHRPDITVEGVT